MNISGGDVAVLIKDLVALHKVFHNKEGIWPGNGSAGVSSGVDTN